MTPVELGDISIGGGNPLVLIAGPCVIESEAHATELAEQLVDVARRLRVPYVFKASFDKANRTSAASFRGPGLDEGLRVLASIKSRYQVPILTDIHEPAQAQPVADVADVLQIPAFLSRQTDLIVAAAKTGRVVNIKKGQFLAPDDVKHAVAKATAAGNPRVVVTERGTSFGYHNLVVDMRSFPIMAAFGYPVVYDATHSLQLPGGGKETGGLKQYAPCLARAAAATGCVDGFFMEVHDDPDHALSDKTTQLDVKTIPMLIRSLLEFSAAARRVAG